MADSHKPGSANAPPLVRAETASSAPEHLTDSDLCARLYVNARTTCAGDVMEVARLSFERASGECCID
jgi:hypothetical protein